MINNPLTSRFAYPIINLRRLDGKEPTQKAREHIYDVLRVAFDEYIQTTPTLKKDMLNAGFRSAVETADYVQKALYERNAALTVIIAKIDTDKELTGRELDILAGRNSYTYHL